MKISIAARSCLQHYRPGKHQAVYRSSLQKTIFTNNPMAHAPLLNNAVTKFPDNLNHPFRNEIEQLRLVILQAGSDLTENIKWNGPDYSIHDKDRITLRIHPPGQVQLIFHRGAKVKEQPGEKLVNDEPGLLTWKENDRAVATFRSLKDIEDRKQDVSNIVNDWIKAAL